MSAADDELGLEYFTGTLGDVGGKLGTTAEASDARIAGKTIGAVTGPLGDGSFHSRVLRKVRSFRKVEQALDVVVPVVLGGPFQGGPGTRVEGLVGQQCVAVEMRGCVCFKRRSWKRGPTCRTQLNGKILIGFVVKKGNAVVEELKQLPSFEAFSKSLADRQVSRAKAAAAESKDVYFKRLVHTMETIVLAQNLPRVATPDVVKRFSCNAKPRINLSDPLSEFLRNLTCVTSNSCSTGVGCVREFNTFYYFRIEEIRSSDESLYDACCPWWRSWFHYWVVYSCRYLRHLYYDHF